MRTANNFTTRRGKILEECKSALLWVPTVALLLLGFQKMHMTLYFCAKSHAQKQNIGQHKSTFLEMHVKYKIHLLKCICWTNSNFYYYSYPNKQYKLNFVEILPLLKSSKYRWLKSKLQFCITKHFDSMLWAVEITKCTVINFPQTRKCF